MTPAGGNGSFATSKPGHGDGAPQPPLLGMPQTEYDRREREHLVRALAATGGNKAEAARTLGVARSTLISRLKKLGLS